MAKKMIWLKSVFFVLIVIPCVLCEDKRDGQGGVAEKDAGTFDKLNDQFF